MTSPFLTMSFSLWPWLRTHPQKQNPDPGKPGSGADAFSQSTDAWALELRSRRALSFHARQKVKRTKQKTKLENQTLKT
jgi:hypothetical protein